MLLHLGWYSTPLPYLKFHFWLKPNQCKSHPCVTPLHPPSGILSGATTSQGSEDGHLTAVRPLTQQPWPWSTHISPLTPARSSGDTRAGSSPDNPTWTSPNDVPGRRDPKMPSNFFFCMKGRKIALRNRRIQHLNKYYRMLFCVFNIGGIMTKSKQNKLLPSPPPAIYSQRVAPGQRKRGAGCRRPLLTSSTSFWKTQGTGLTSFPRSKLTSLRIPLPSLSPEQELLEEMMFHRVQKQNANSLGGEINLVQAEVGTHIGMALLAQGVFAFFLKMLLCKSLNSTKRKDLFHNSSSAGELRHQLQGSDAAWENWNDLQLPRIMSSALGAPRGSCYWSIKS